MLGSALPAFAVECRNPIYNSALSSADINKLEPVRRVLSIGNSTYPEPMLQVPEALNDVRIFSEGIESLSIKPENIIAKSNLTRLQMLDEIDDFACSIASGDVAIFHYSGHGVQFGKLNYLVPTDGKIKSVPRASQQLVPLSYLLDRMSERKPSALIVFLDACRTNPFPWVGAGPKSGADPDRDGLAKVDLRMSLPQVMIFAAQPGRAANQWSQENIKGQGSVFTRNLVSNMDSNLDIDGLVGKAASAIKYETGFTQSPHMDETIFVPVYIVNNEEFLLKSKSAWEKLISSNLSTPSLATEFFFFLNEYPGSVYEYRIRRFIFENLDKLNEHQQYTYSHLVHSRSLETSLNPLGDILIGDTRFEKSTNDIREVLQRISFDYNKYQVENSFEFDFRHGLNFLPQELSEKIGKLSPASEKVAVSISLDKKTFNINKSKKIKNLLIETLKNKGFKRENIDLYLFYSDEENITKIKIRSYVIAENPQYFVSNGGNLSASQLSSMHARIANGTSAFAITDAVNLSRQNNFDDIVVIGNRR